MFCHWHSSCCRYNSRCRRNIEGIGAVSAGSYQIDKIVRMWMNVLCFICQHRCQTNDLINGLTFHTQSGQKCSDLRLCGCASQKKLHYFFCLCTGQILSVCYSLNCLLHIHDTNSPFLQPTAHKSVLAHIKSCFSSIPLSKFVHMQNL